MTQTEAFADALRARGYPLAVIVHQLSRVSYDQRYAYLGLEPSDVPARPSAARRIPLVLPFSPTLFSLQVGQHLRRCFSDPGVQHVTPVVAWRNGANLQGRLKLQWPKTDARSTGSGA
jgi:hypothetical protein